MKTWISKIRIAIYLPALALCSGFQPVYCQSSSGNKPLDPQIGIFLDAGALGRKIQEENQPGATSVCGEQGTFKERILDCSGKNPLKAQRCFLRGSALHDWSAPDEVDCQSDANVPGKVRIVWTLATKDKNKEAWLFDDPTWANDILWVVWPTYSGTWASASDFCQGYDMAYNLGLTRNDTDILQLYLPFSVDDFPNAGHRGIYQVISALNWRYFWSWTLHGLSCSETDGAFVQGAGAGDYTYQPLDTKHGLSCTTSLSKGKW